MSDDKYHDGFEGADAPEETKENPTAPVESSEDDAEAENRLEGAIGTGDLAEEYPEEEPANEEAAPVEETPAVEEPVAEEAPVETPAEEPAEEPAAPVDETPVTAAPEPTVAEVAAQNAETGKKKKSKKGLVITLIIIALLLIGGGVGAFIWIMIHESPETSLKDAMNKFWAADHIQTSAAVDVKSNGVDGTVTFDGVAAGSNIGGSGKIKTNFQGQDIEIAFSAAYTDNDSVYLKIEGLKDTLKTLNLESILQLFSGDASSAALLSEIVDAVVEEVEGDWYKMPLSAAGTVGNQSLSCLSEALSASKKSETKNIISDEYAKNPFFNIKKDAKVTEKDGVKYYEIEYDDAKSKAFAEGLKNNDSLKSLATCFATSETKVEASGVVYDAEDDEDLVAPTTGEEQIEVAKKAKVKFGIKPWTHELVAIELSADNEANSGNAKIKLSYDKKEVTVPSDAKDFDSLKSSIEKAVKNALTNFVDKQCQTYYGAYGDAMVSACKTAMMKQLEEKFSSGINLN